MCREMKDTGIEWIGEINNEWSIIKIAKLAQFINGYAFNGEDLTIENEIPVIRIGDIQEGGVNLEGCLKYKKDEKLYPYSIQSKDVLIAMSGATTGKTAFINEVDSVAYINQRVGIIRNSKYSKYINYSLNTGEFKKYIDLIADGSAQPNISTKRIMNYYLALPNKGLDNIINYLDEKVSKIDNIISKQKSLIEKYKAYKQSIITETVTKGLNKNVPMKDSGIEWIGEIPSHWNIEKGKHILNLLSRQVNEEDEVITCFRDGEVTLRSNRREEGFTFADKEIGYQGIEPGDLVIHGMDGFAGAIGISDARGKASPVLNVCDTKENKRYIMYYLRRLAYNNVFLALATGIRVRSCDLRWNKIGNLLYPIPPKDEQDIIVDYLDNKIIKIDNLVQIKQDYVDKLEEYKKSLIYECVTGKREMN